MHMLFTEEEKEWIDMKPFNWQIKEGCPEKLKKQIQKKLNALKK